MPNRPEIYERCAALPSGYRFRVETFEQFQDSRVVSVIVQRKLDEFLWIDVTEQVSMKIHDDDEIQDKALAAMDRAASYFYERDRLQEDPGYERYSTFVEF